MTVQGLPPARRRQLLGCDRYVQLSPTIALDVASGGGHRPAGRGQEAVRTRRGVALSSSARAESIGAISVALQPVVDALRREPLASPVLHADEERALAQLDPGRGQTERACVTARCSTGPRSLIVFVYCASRSDHPAHASLATDAAR
jgi:transposase